MISKLRTKLLRNFLTFLTVYISGLWVLYLVYSLPKKFKSSGKPLLRKRRYIFFNTPWVYSKEFKIGD